MLTGLKVSILACKCVFYRPEEFHFEGLDMQELYQPTELKELMGIDRLSIYHVYSLR